MLKQSREFCFYLIDLFIMFYNLSIETLNKTSGNK
jgi:hypothetical protein